MTLTKFVEASYLPFVKTHKRPSTYAGYRNMWKRYLKDHGDIALRDFRTVEGEEILNNVAAAEDLSRTTMAHVKAFLSGVFRYAKRQGVINTENPMRDVVLPKVRPGGERMHTLWRRSSSPCSFFRSRQRPLSPRRHTPDPGGRTPRYALGKLRWA